MCSLIYKRFWPGNYFEILGTSQKHFVTISVVKRGLPCLLLETEPNFPIFLPPGVHKTLLWRSSLPAGYETTLASNYGLQLWRPHSSWQASALIPGQWNIQSLPFVSCKFIWVIIYLTKIIHVKLLKIHFKLFRNMNTFERARFTCRKVFAGPESFCS